MHFDSLTCSDEQFKIISFTMSISFPNSDVWDESSTSNLLTTTMKQMIHRAEKGSRIWIDKIKAKSPDGVEYFLKEIALRVD